MESAPFKDSNLSMAARGMLSTLMATGGNLEDYYFGKNRSYIRELMNKGYIYETDEDGLRVYNVDTVPHKVKKDSKSSKYIKILHDALGGPMWRTDFLCVHHINHDRSDNRVSNLLLIPRRMHAKYHMLYNMVEGMCGDILETDLYLNIMNNGDTIKEFIDLKIDMAYMQQQQFYAVNNKKTHDSLGVNYDGFSYLCKRVGHIYERYM